MRIVQAMGLGIVCGLSAAMGCQLLTGIDNDDVFIYDPSGTVAVSANSTSSGDVGGAGGAGGMMMSSSSSSTGMGGTGGAPECMTKDDCDKYECKTATGCSSGKCVWQNKPLGDNVISQLAGDCKLAQCDGNGGIAFVDLMSDLYTWSNPCLLKTCDPSKPPELDISVTTCITPWGSMGGTCDAVSKTCIECDGDTCGAGKVCKNHRCYPDTCEDGLMNGNESAKDCGGTECDPCADGMACLVHSDCLGSCDAGMMKCIAGTCNDMVRNGDETAEDCGGTCAAMMGKKCADDKACFGPSDCLSGVCKANVCVAPTCIDGQKNGTEDGIDCGKGCPFACP